jgi:hypothetical protein
MNVYRFMLTASICLAFHFPLFSQSHDKSGYYIDLKGDTIFGKFIDYQFPSKSPSVLSFQANSSSDTTSLSPGKCKKVSVDQSDKYIAYRGKRQTNAVDYRDATDSGDVYEDISAFLQVLYDDGHYQLYEFLDKRRPNFYVSQDDGPLQELSYKEFLNNGTVVDWPGFRLQLEDLFRPILVQKPEKQRLIDNVPYNSPGLADLFSRMATGKKAVSVKGKYPAKVFVGFGSSSNSLKVTAGSGSNNISTDEVGNYPSQTSPLFEAGLKFFSQRNYGRFFGTIRADYYHFKHTLEFNDNPGGILTLYTITTYESNVLSIPIGLGYKILNSEHFSLDLSAGASFSLLLKDSETKIPNSTINTTPSSAAPRTSTFSFFGEAAIVLYDRFSVFIGYYTPASITKAMDHNATHSSLEFGARYFIF